MDTFLKVLDPADTSTGGGSASAVAGAMAGALLAMVARLSEATQEESEVHLCERIFTQAGQLSQELLEGSQEDALAFQGVRRAYQLPRQTDEATIARQQAVQEAWLRAASVPLENAGRCLRVVELGGELAGRVNPKVISDYRCALLLAQAGLLGCLENVYINLPAINDATLAEQLARQARDLSERLRQTDSLSNEVR
jgi:formiminotetrahydrofolate cyclodeaminase